MMTGMGLALGIDYSLFVISRFREERARGLHKDAAIAVTGGTASRAVLFSGTTFVIALLGLFIVPTNVLRSLAAGAIIVGIVSVVAALTLLPAMLSLIGDRINALRIPFFGANLGRADAVGGPRLARLHRQGPAAPGRQPRRDRRPHDRRRAPGARPAHRPERRRHPARDASVQAGLPGRPRYFPGQDPNPVEIVIQGNSPGDHADLATLQATLAADPRFGPGTIQASPHGHVLALTVPIRGDAVSSAGCRRRAWTCAST